MSCENSEKILAEDEVLAIIAITEVSIYSNGSYDRQYVLMGYLQNGKIVERSEGFQWIFEDIDEEGSVYDDSNPAPTSPGIYAWEGKVRTISQENYCEDPTERLTGIYRRATNEDLIKVGMLPIASPFPKPFK